ncbi:hypothetical protein B0O99DRAFT_636567 [Bisporella sp. PMI_857]|nr:hypothetical protein B0O99DRAFT_636567 [Bisporella sp. PMI_857]
MLPDFLKPSYKRYKDDTDHFAFWLVNIAKKCGLQPDSATQKNSNTETPGKAKSKGKPVESKYVATTSELLNIGQAIANSAVRVPASILALGKRAIKLRKDVTSHFWGKGDIASNKRHAHFISVLENICEALEWQKATEASSKNKPPVDHDKDVDTQAWLNRFAALTVEELQDVPESIADASEIMKVEVVEDDDVADEAADAYLSHHFFMIFCLLYDLQNWRTFISQTWTEYRDLKIDLMTASIITDNAVQLAQTLIKEVVDSWPRKLPGDDLEIQRILYATACLAHGVDELVSPSLTFNIKLADFADWCYLPTATLLQSFIPVFQDNSVPVYKPGYFGTYDPKADRANMSVVERFNEDKLILMELLPEFCVMDMFHIRMPVSDKITSGFVEFIHDKKPTLWLSFAAQILLDTHHTMRSSRLGAFGDLRMSGLRIARTIEDFWKLSETHPKPKFWPQAGDDEIKRIRQCIETFIEKDPLLVVRQTLARELSYQKQDYPDHFVFSRNPVLCGLIMTHLNLSMQTVGQLLVNQWYDVQQMAFLYNLVQQSSSKLVWPDIEMFIKIHGENRIFIGDRPKDAAQSLNRLEMVTGISSATRFARDSRQGRVGFHNPDKNWNAARLLEPTTKVVNLFRDQYMAGININAISSANVEKLLNDLSDEAKTTANKSKKGGKKGELPLSSNSQLLLERKWSRTHNIGPLQLLALIKSKLCEEEPVILFNYFGMHKRSIEILRLIKAKEHHKFVQYFTPHYMPNDSMISNLVILVHHVARGSAQAGGLIGLGTDGKMVVSRIVVSCGDVMEDYLKKNGDAACKELRIFCKNKTQLKTLEEGSDRQNKEMDKQFGYWFSLEEAMGPAWIASIMTGIPVA